MEAGRCVLDRQGKADTRRALVLAIRDALHDAGLEPTQVGHYNAHGLATVESDRLEAEAVLEVFGDYGRKIPVTAFKSYLGNPGASCGTLELAGSLAGLQHGVVLPTLNYQTPDPACPLNVVAGAPLPVENRVFVSANVTRVGQASAVVMSGA